VLYAVGLNDHAAQVWVWVALNNREVGFATHLAAQPFVNLAPLRTCVHTKTGSAFFFPYLGVFMTHFYPIRLPDLSATCWQNKAAFHTGFPCASHPCPTSPKVNDVKLS